jgi:ADP-heptose:LPS heptosyltransferase
MTRILIVVGGNRIGDSLAALPVIRAVRRHFGEGTEVGLLHPPVEPGFPSAADVLSEAIDCSFPSGPHSSLRATANRARKLRARDFAYAVYAGYARPSRRRLWGHRIFLTAAGIKPRFGFRRYEEDPRAVLAGKLKPESQRRLENVYRDGISRAPDHDLASPLLPLSPAQRQLAATWLTSRRRDRSRPLVAICPGARSPANHWPLARFKEIGRRLLRLNKYEIIVCGGSAETSAAEELIADWGSGIDATGLLSPLETAARLAECRLVLGLDTGTTHLAAARGVPCVTLQGGRVPRGQWDPTGDLHHILRYEVPCQGCGRTRCPFTLHPCMKGISVDRVWRTLLTALEEDGP